METYPCIAVSHFPFVLQITGPPRSEKFPEANSAILLKRVQALTMRRLKDLQKGQIPGCTRGSRAREELQDHHHHHHHSLLLIPVQLAPLIRRPVQWRRKLENLLPPPRRSTRTHTHGQRLIKKVIQLRQSGPLTAPSHTQGTTAPCTKARTI